MIMYHPACEATVKLKGVEPRLVAALLLAATRYQRYYHRNRRIRVTDGLGSRLLREKLYNRQFKPEYFPSSLAGATVEIAIMEFCLGGEPWVMSSEPDDYLDFHQKFFDPAAEELGIILDWWGYTKTNLAGRWEIANTKLFP